MVFFDELATNATSHNVSIVMYARNDDPYYSHRGTDSMFLSIQGDNVNVDAPALQW